MLKSVTTIFLLGCVAGCATQQQNSALECGAAGAGIAFLICKVAGGSDATCAAAGGALGVAGGALCYKLSDNMDKRRKELVGRENDLDARLQYVRGVNADTARYNENLKKQVATLDQRTGEVEQQVRQQTISQKQLADQRKALDQALRNVNDAVKAQSSSLEFMRTYQAQQATKSRELATEIQRQQSLLAETQRQAAALAEMRQRV